MAYFGGLGYVLDSSGGPDILTETEVLAAGSLHGFLTGKHYTRYICENCAFLNRCNRLHTILAAVFHVLHFRSFLEVEGPKSRVTS